jgi:hypothetical protein
MTGVSRRCDTVASNQIVRKSNFRLIDISVCDNRTAARLTEARLAFYWLLSQGCCVWPANASAFVPGPGTRKGVVLPAIARASIAQTPFEIDHGDVNEAAAGVALGKIDAVTIKIDLSHGLQ